MKFFAAATALATAAVSGQWVALKTDSTSYSLTAQQNAATKFFVNKYAPTGTFAVHNADDTRQLALQGSNGILLSLVDATNPTTDSIPKGTLMEWATFTMDNNVLFVKDGSTLANRTFVAVKVSGSDYSIALYDGASTTTSTITPVTINIVKA
ncbi:hypothetical protein PMIN03_002659 [Paraphaeosphaeria minitans]